MGGGVGIERQFDHGELLLSIFQMTRLLFLSCAHLLMESLNWTRLWVEPSPLLDAPSGGRSRCKFQVRGLRTLAMKNEVNILAAG